MFLFKRAVYKNIVGGGGYMRGFIGLLESGRETRL